MDSLKADVLKLQALKHKFEYDPAFQTKFHLRMTYFWLFNMIGVTTVFIAAPGVWAQISLLYLVLVSLYANAATDYGAVSASEASEHAKTAAES